MAGLSTLLVFALIWLGPTVEIARSNRTSGNEKMVWILAVLLMSWFAWILYSLLAPLKQPSHFS